MKYRAKEPPEIHIFCRSEGDSCLVAVGDNGIGIAPEHQERAFRMFTRLEPGLAWGTGMGLALSRKIVERHGGKMWVESEPGKGSTFYFTLPLALRRSTSTGS
jgi:signal transduction histidine kinase